MVNCRLDCAVNPRRGTAAVADDDESPVVTDRPSRELNRKQYVRVFLDRWYEVDELDEKAEGA